LINRWFLHGKHVFISNLQRFIDLSYRSGDPPIRWAWRAARLSWPRSNAFTIRARYNRQQRTIRFEEVTEWPVVPSAVNQALQTTALVLLTIPLIPLAFLAGLAGWDGC